MFSRQSPEEGEGLEFLPSVVGARAGSRFAPWSGSVDGRVVFNWVEFGWFVLLFVFV